MTEIPTLLINLLALVGLFFTANVLITAAKQIMYYSRHKAFPKSLEEEKLLLIREENKRLSTKIAQLENENEQMTLSVLQKFKNG
tara:strand:- start:325 stop:579 length:255 start_codon:yes stop_codon:yes gene_type:complete